VNPLDVVVKSFDEMDSGLGGMYVRARAELGVSSFGMQVIRLQANSTVYPEHAHRGAPHTALQNDHEEVYVPLSGNATLIAGDHTWELRPGVAARVAAQQLRTIVTGPTPFEMLALGGAPGRVYEPVAFSEVGAGETPRGR
jgi:hypothetical protein